MLLRLGILLAGVIVCLPALFVAFVLRDQPGAPLAALAAFSFIFSPFVFAAIYAGRFREMFAELTH